MAYLLTLVYSDERPEGVKLDLGLTWPRVDLSVVPVPESFSQLGTVLFRLRTVII
jgi:hypothetical protein